jgi:VWFA-related protein
VSRRALLFGGAALWAQDPQTPTYSTGVHVVNVFVTVRDKKNHVVKDLQKDDFTLAEDGRAQQIRYFSRESDLPLTIGLIVDMTPSESNMLEVERSTSRAFLDKMLRPERDQAFLIQFGDDVELLQDLTSSRDKLARALNRLRRSEMGGGRGRMPSRTILSDSISLASDEIMAKQPGRKALLIMGDGDHIGSRAEEAIAAAQRADTSIYAIRIYDSNRDGGGGFMRGIPGMGGPGMGGPGGRGGGHGGPGGGPGMGGNGKRDLKELAARTGGGYFEVSKKNTLDQIYAEIEAELRSQYSLGYTPDDEQGSSYRRIKVGVRQSGLTVQGRDGYYAISI